MAEIIDREMPLTEHLEELRGRLIRCLLSLAVGTAVAWAWSGDFLSWLARPVGGLVFLTPTEAFFTRLKTAMYGGFLLTLPILLHQAWGFTAVAMGRGLKRVLVLIVPASFVLFLSGIALSVFVVVPAAMRFLVAYGSSDIRPMLTVSAYLEFITTLSLAFGVVFQIPLVLILLQKAGIVTREGLASRRRYVILGAFIVGGALTPGPDVFSQVCLAIPVIILFEIALLVMAWQSKPDAAVPSRDR